MNTLCNYTCIDSLRIVRPKPRNSTAGFRSILPSGIVKVCLSISILAVFFLSSLSAQTDFYDENFVKITDLNQIKAFVSDMKENCVSDRYRINKTPVVEYYDKENKSFKGMCLNSDMVSFDKINIIKKDKNLKKFIKIHGIQLGSALYFKRPFDGMTQGQLKLIVGEPDKIKYAIDGESQIIKFKYNNGKVFSFKDGKLQQPINQISKTPIALKQP